MSPLFLVFSKTCRSHRVPRTAFGGGRFGVRNRLSKIRWRERFCQHPGLECGEKIESTKNSADLELGGGLRDRFLSLLSHRKPIFDGFDADRSFKAIRPVSAP